MLFGLACAEVERYLLIRAVSPEIQFLRPEFSYNVHADGHTKESGFQGKFHKARFALYFGQKFRMIFDEIRSND